MKALNFSLLILCLATSSYGQYLSPNKIRISVAQTSMEKSHSYTICITKSNIKIAYERIDSVRKLAQREFVLTVKIIGALGSADEKDQNGKSDSLKMYEKELDSINKASTFLTSNNIVLKGRMFKKYKKQLDFVFANLDRIRNETKRILFCKGAPYYFAFFGDQKNKNILLATDTENMHPFLKELLTDTKRLLTNKS